MDRSEAQPKFPPKAAFANITIISDMSSQQLINTVERLFQQHPVLRDALPCSRYGAGSASLDCRKVIQADVFEASLESGKQTLMLSIVPRTQDFSYRPDYEHFRELKGEIARMLASHFGASNVIVK